MNEMLKTDSSIANEKDVIGGGFRPLDTDAYEMTINNAYFDKSSGGAMSLNLDLSNSKGDKLRTTIYITSKAGRNFYFVKDKSGKPTEEKQYLPGFNIANAICLLTVGTEIADLRIWDFNPKSSFFG